MTAIRAGADAEAIELRASDKIEEPDVLSSWDELDAFYARQGELAARLGGESVELRAAGEWRAVRVTRRGLFDLSLSFYTLLITPFVAWMVGFATYAFSDRGLAARLYVVSAVAIAVAVWPTAIYAMRPLALAPDVFRLHSTVDHAGGLFFASGVIAMLAVYPVRLVERLEWFFA